MRLLLKQGENPSAVKRKPTRKRKSRDRRLLEALLSGQFGTSDTGIWIGVKKTRFSKAQMKQLIAIKEAIKKGGGK